MSTSTQADTFSLWAIANTSSASICSTITSTVAFSTLPRSTLLLGLPPVPLLSGRHWLHQLTQIHCHRLPHQIIKKAPFHHQVPRCLFPLLNPGCRPRRLYLSHPQKRRARQPQLLRLWHLGNRLLHLCQQPLKNHLLRHHLSRPQRLPQRHLHLFRHPCAPTRR